MATNFLTFNPVQIRASAAGNNHNHRRSLSPSTSSPPNPNWWTPLFGWSSDPDYIDSNNSSKTPENANESENKASRSKMSAGRFTEEKARRLRMMTTGTEAFHDVMYHSAIASRLASDFSHNPDHDQ